jgi:hypothetical protein
MFSGSNSSVPKIDPFAGVRSFSKNEEKNVYVDCWLEMYMLYFGCDVEGCFDGRMLKIDHNFT